MREIKTLDAPQAVGPYSQAIEVDGFVFVSGQIPLTTEGKVIEGGIEEQTHQVMQNLEAILEESALSFANVVKTEIFLTNLVNFKAVNEIYASYMQKPYPARATLGVASLPLGVEVEIAMIAKK
jgi:2-iminobutanoate/2-iminopropanoate deaminase